MTNTGPYTEADLREAFKAGWKERDKRPGLKKQIRGSIHNAIGGAIGMPRQMMDADYVPDHRTYHNSIWLNSSFRKGLSND